MQNKLHNLIVCRKKILPSSGGRKDKSLQEAFLQHET